jgi:hypothetical protein
MLTALLFFSLLIGTTFGFIAGAIAFVITYNEWQKHRYEGWRLWKEALKAGVFAFVFFLVLSLCLGLILSALHI